MSFLVAAALAIAVLAVVPLLAHLLRRSRADDLEFPPARLVPTAQPVARQRSRLEDRALLAVRAALILVLALLGATPFVSCSRLSISRDAGGSVALALVIDDSLSMRARTDGRSTRWDVALRGARDLLAAAREGDAVAIVLAGSPARLALAATTDLGAARRAVAELHPTDRPTDLEAAVQIARSALQQLPHLDRRVVLLSDLAGPPIPKGEPTAWAPLAELRVAHLDCGVVSAESRGRRVSVDVACSSARAARDRELELVGASTRGPSPTDAGEARAKAGERLASAKLEPRAGAQTVVLTLETVPIGLEARLVGGDAIERDDVAPVVPAAGALVLGLAADPATGSVSTGGPTVLEQAVSSLGLELTQRPLTVLPDDPRELSAIAALIVDDPSGFTPEVRDALTSWLERGGVALAWLGPRCTAAQLGATLEPFVQGAASWEKTKAVGIDPASVAWLGAPAASLNELAPRGRVSLDGVHGPATQVLARWNDGRPWLVQTEIGRGLAMAAGLPVSVDESDVALRPGFLALLEHVVSLAARRVGPRRSVAGTAWAFSEHVQARVEGPEGQLQPTERAGSGAGATTLVVPEQIGRYRVTLDGETEERTVAIDPKEVTDGPREPDAQSSGVAPVGAATRIDASAELALALLALFLLELGLRGLRRLRPRRGRRTTDRVSMPG